MWSYKIIKIVPSEATLNVYFLVLRDGVVFKEDFILIAYTDLFGSPSDGRAEFVQGQVVDACKKYMVIQDVKQDFSSLIDIETEIQSIEYKTKADKIQENLDAIAAQAAKVNH